MDADRIAAKREGAEGHDRGERFAGWLVPRLSHHKPPLAADPGADPIYGQYAQAKEKGAVAVDPHGEQGRQKPEPTPVADCQFQKNPLHYREERAQYQWPDGQADGPEKPRA